MSKIDHIKNHYKIRDLAERAGAIPNRSGKCKANPIRQEKTSSLVIYDDTNSFHDFGSGVGGDVITFYSELHGMDIPDTIESMLREIGMTGDDFSIPVQKVHQPITNINNKYMSDGAVKKAFNSIFNININHTDHSEILETIAPRYLYDEATEDDYTYFFEHVKYNKGDDTAIVLLPDEKGASHTFRYRNKMVGDNLKKWVALAGTRADYLYCRLNTNRITLIVEGTRDFLTAVLCGYSVIALPRANYKEIPEEILIDRLCVFIDDDDGKESMKELFASTICDKVFFDHKRFKQITKCKSKDLSDYLYKFKHLADFKDTFERFIGEIGVQKDNWLSCIEDGSHITLDFLENSAPIASLVDKFIYKNTATVLHSNPGAGKSTFVLALAKQLLSEKKLSNVLYFDADNPLSVIKDRVSGLKKEFGDDVLYFTNSTSGIDAMKQQMERLCLFRGKGEDTLIIVDTLAKFVDGSVNNDKEVKPMLDLICKVRDEFGATVIIIHHSNKAKDDEGRNIFRGSQMIIGDTDATWGIQRTGSKVMIRQDKVRFGDMYDTISTTINSKSLTFETFEGGYASDSVDEEDSEINVNDIVTYLQNARNKPFTSALKKEFGAGVVDIMKKHDGELWNSTSAPFGKKYSLINQPMVIEYEMDEEEAERIFG